MRFLMATLVWGAMAAAASAAAGECSVTGYDTFDCDVVLDGGGLTFGLPDGGIFAFALLADGVGEAYLIAPGSAPGQPPQMLRDLRPVDGKAGCWAREDAFEFCALVEE
jgi:hypothetical protein